MFSVALCVLAVTVSIFSLILHFGRCSDERLLDVLSNYTHFVSRRVDVFIPAVDIINTPAIHVFVYLLGIFGPLYLLYLRCVHM